MKEERIQEISTTVNVICELLAKNKLSFGIKEGKLVIVDHTTNKVFKMSNFVSSDLNPVEE